MAQSDVRKRAYGVAMMVAAALVMTGCSAGGDTANVAPASADTGFPVTVTHGMGTVTIEAKPERVVVLGSADAQIASALELPIVGAVSNPSSADGNWPGIATPLPKNVTVLDSVEPNLEQIAQMDPDLILATTSQPSYIEAYEQLSKIAPVISYKTTPLQDSGEELVTLIGEASGKSKAATALIAASDSEISEFAAEFPQLEGAGYVFGQYAGGVTYLIVSPDALSVQFMSRLGFTVPEQVSAPWDSSDTSYAASLGMITPSNEQLDLLDSADIAFISAFGDGAAEEFTSIPLVSSLELLGAHRLHLIGQDLAAPLLQPNPSTTTYVLDKLRPYVESFVQGSRVQSSTD